MGAFGDAAIYPPEATYQIMATGDQGASLLDAAAGHQTVADMLIAEMTAMGFNTTSTAMVAWQGVGGAAMEMTAGEFIAMCEAVSAWCQQGSFEAAAVAEAHGFALAQMVPAEVCLENRSELATLVATNFLGVNTPAIGVNNATYTGYWITNATARSGYGAVVTASNISTATPAPFAPMVTNPAGPAEAVAQAAARDTGHAVTASSKSVTQAAEMPAKGTENMGSSMAGQLGGIVGQLGSGFGQITQMGGQLPQMAGQAPQMFQGLLGPLMQGMGMNGAASMAPGAAGAIAPVSSVGGLGGLSSALGGAGGGGGGLTTGTSALSSSFVRPAGSFSTPNSPTLPGGWQSGPGGGSDASPARAGGPGGGGLYGAPPASMAGAGGASQSDQKAGRTMQVTSRGATRGERQSI